MKAMILAAGLGTRMRPLTDHTPKPLLQAGGKALIDYHIEKLAAIGVSNIVVNCSWLADQLAHYLGDGSRYGLNIIVSREDQPLETAGGIVNALPLLLDDMQKDEPFILVNGDIWTDFDFADLLNCRPESGHLVMVENPPHNPSGDFVLSAEGLISERQGSHDNEDTASPVYTFSGISVWRPSVFEDFNPGKRPLKPVMLAAMEKQRLSGRLHAGAWWDIGTPERLAALDAMLSA
nr:nucleotidyltransferase family protein [Zhongshania aliphaticivorans]